MSVILRENSLRKPTMTNWISPYEAMMIPTMMADTFASFFMSGGEIMNAHVARRVAITFDAFNIWMKDTLR